MRKNKSTSFKTKDAYEKRLLAWAESDERGDFSKYIKRLIGRDMDGQTTPHVYTHLVEEDVVKDDFRGFI